MKRNMPGCCLDIALDVSQAFASIYLDIALALQ